MTAPSLTLCNDTLSGIGLFGGLKPEALNYLRVRMEERSFAADECAFRRGDAGRELFVLLEGKLEIRALAQDGSERIMLTLGPGDWFGQSSLLDFQPRGASAITLCYTRIAVLGCTALDGLYRSDTKAYALLLLNIARELSRQLRSLEARWLDTATSSAPEDSRTRES